MNIRASALVCVLLGNAAFASVAAAQPQPVPIDLQQNWTAEQKEQFWFTPQGSLLLPYQWFLYLKKASSNDELFRSDANMRRLGYLPSAKSTLNRDGLPIGFARDSDRDGHPFVGFTCAACHTSTLKISNADVTVEGAPALSDFWLFVSDLVSALDDTAASSSKFADFAKDVLGSHTQEQEAALKQELDDRRTDLRRRWLSMPPSTPYGLARLDAFGGLYNQVVAYDLVPKNAEVPDAPVSYPFLWDTPQHDKVQWNGSADNGLLGLGPVFRNIGEALGVFGTLTIEHQSGAPKYVSSVNVTNLQSLEELVRHLRSPVWPREVLPIDPAAVRTGAVVYNMFCSSCHEILKDRTDLNRKIKAKMVDVKSVGTDPRFAINYAERFVAADAADTGVLARAFKLYPVLLNRFGKSASGGDIFANAVLGAYRGRKLRTRGVETTATTVEEDAATITAIRQFSSTIQQTKIEAAYKARPLDGIWATAPFLHNGSVPTVTELLKPAKDRVKRFWIGSHELDAVNVGLSVAKTADGFLFDTTQPGNSNQGHEYGTLLDDDHKKALIEFLKTL